MLAEIGQSRIHDVRSRAAQERRAVKPQSDQDGTIVSNSAKKSATTKSSRRRTIAVAVVLGVLVVIGGGYVAGYFMAGDQTPRNASVAGVPIGGMTPEEAVTTLETELAEQSNQPITVVVDGEEVQVTPAETGLGIDYEATVDQAGAGRSWNPMHIWQVLTGGGDLKPVYTRDAEQLRGTAHLIAADFERPASNAGLAYVIEEDSVKLERTPGVQARSVDAEDLATKLEEAYPDQDRVEPAVELTDPAITDADVEAAAAEWGEPAISGPVVVKVGDQTVEVSPAQIAESITITPAEDAITHTVDQEKLWTLVQPQIDKLKMDRGTDARVELQNGRPVVIPSKDGLGVKKENFLEAVMPALTSAEREVQVEAVVMPAEFTTEDAEKLGIKEVIGEFTTYFPHADYRNTNLTVASRAINNTMVKPGEIFSLNDTLGPRTNERGYVDGWVIQGGKMRKETAGGISQASTTTFNAAFFAGLEDVEHHPHSLYFPRYPAGRESTIYYGSKDMRFRNNTDYGIVMQAFVNPSSPGKQGSMTVRVWSTKTWDEIYSPEPTKSDFRDGRTVHDDSPECSPQAMSPGFLATYYRVFRKNGVDVRREDFSWRYDPTDRVICD
ncbi:hypothetical protein CGZ92_10125 [Parenemella sanctibonifatiensis]|uniref:YoaR-like putative peptidoglycan binding domain-containing protein n=1 Tax=Parenemella sanctibonifatiensis TaxID=2016505 RepID=A0A255E8T9_9ACTN|nr:hypothetical protein CGZ92_10125 [Parenemella sanctibonifatiensis]